MGSACSRDTRIHVLDKKIRELILYNTDHKLGVYSNWSKNIITDISIQYPTNDTDLQQILRDLKQRGPGHTLRIVGNAHSVTNVVCSSDEGKQGNVTIAQLSSYSAEAVGKPDFQLDTEADSVWVNAGWSLQQFYDSLQNPQKGGDEELFLHAQTAGPFFTLGGVLGTSCHGGAVHYGLICDSVLALRVMTADGTIAEVVEEEELRYWRFSAGMLGIVTHIKFSCKRICETQQAHKDQTMDLSSLERFQELLGANPKVASDAGPDLDEFHKHWWQEYFWNPHNSKVLSIRWKVTDQKVQYATGDTTRYRSGAPTLKAAEGMLKSKWTPLMGTNARFSLQGVSDFIDVALQALKDGLKTDEVTENDMFYLEYATAAIFGNYFVPCGSDWSGAYKALQVVEEVVRQQREQDSPYKLDLPVEFRFVRGSCKGYMSPIYADGVADTPSGPMWIAVNIASYSSGLDVSFKEQDTPIMRSFLECMAKLEKGFRSIPGAQPHTGKLYGVLQDADGKFHQFHPAVTRSILPEERKQKMRDKQRELDPDGVFDREMVRQLLQQDDGEVYKLVQHSFSEDFTPEWWAGKQNQPLAS